jgi:hypothetical protein
MIVINWVNQQMNPAQQMKKALFSQASFSPCSTGRPKTGLSVEDSREEVEDLSLFSVAHTRSTAVGRPR